MKVRRIQYSIDYIHIISFKEEYKDAVIPFFGFDKLRYGIDDENTINERIRLIFTLENIAIYFRKDGLTIVYEGEVDNLKKSNGVMDIFWNLYENVKNLKGFQKTTRHSIVLTAVDILDKSVYEKLMKNTSNYLYNPFDSALKELNCVYEFQEDNKYYKFEFGNYTEKDIENHDLRPFKTETTSDLIGTEKVGVMSRAEIKEESSEVSFTRFKRLLSETEKLISKYNYESQLGK